MCGRGRVSKVLRSTALTQFPRWTPQVADEIPDRKLLTTNVKPVFRSCLFNIAHSGGRSTGESPAKPHAAVIGMDIPIGLPDMGSRQCDIDARSLLGKRGSSVFPAPLRGMLAATGYQEACELGRQTDGRAISRQCFGILPKIREVDCAMSPQLQQRVFEVHPEVSFWASNQSMPMQNAKKCVDGRRDRLDLLRPTVPVIEDIRVNGRAAKDDILDAAAVMWTAERIFRGEAVGVSAVEEFDSKGLRMQITY